MVDEITLWHLMESKRRLIKQNVYIREQVSHDKLGLRLAFFNRATGKIEFFTLYKPDIIKPADLDYF